MEFSLPQNWALTLHDMTAGIHQGLQSPEPSLSFTVADRTSMFDLRKVFSFQVCDNQHVMYHRRELRIRYQVTPRAVYPYRLISPGVINTPRSYSEINQTLMVSIDQGLLRYLPLSPGYSWYLHRLLAQRVVVDKPYTVEFVYRITDY